MFIWEQFLYVFIIFSALLIIGQRISKRHQRGFRIALVILALGWMWMRFGQFPFEMVTGFVSSLVLSFLFWLLIGRYNPVGNADEEQIKVYGLND